MTTADQPFAWGPFVPVTEEVTLTDLVVEGEIPRELDGLLVRNGPNPYRPAEAGDHWFTGDGMLHGLRLAGGRARSYQNRWVRTGYLAWQRGEGPKPEPGRIVSSVLPTRRRMDGRARAAAARAACVPASMPAPMKRSGSVNAGPAIARPSR